MLPCAVQLYVYRIRSDKMVSDRCKMDLIIMVVGDRSGL